MIMPTGLFQIRQTFEKLIEESPDGSRQREVSQYILDAIDFFADHISSRLALAWRDSENSPYYNVDVALWSTFAEMMGVLFKVNCPPAGMISIKEKFKDVRDAARKDSHEREVAVEILRDIEFILSYVDAQLMLAVYSRSQHYGNLYSADVVLWESLFNMLRKDAAKE